MIRIGIPDDSARSLYVPSAHNFRAGTEIINKSYTLILGFSWDDLHLFVEL